MTILMIKTGQAATKNFWIEGELTFHYCVAFSLEILKAIDAVLPAWLLSILGLIRAFLGENAFSFAKKIPIRVTKTVLALSAILLVGVTVAGAIYSEYTGDSFHTQYVMKNRFEGWQNVLAWILFLSILLYIEQRCIHRDCFWKDIRKKQVWVIVSIFLSCLIVFFLGCVGLWYIPLGYVDCPNDLEDYYLWWSSLYTAVLFLPFWFFSVRKTIRVFRDNTQWLALTTVIPKTITVLIALASTGFMVQQIQESRYWNEWTEFADLPEYGEAAAMGHTFRAMMWGLLLFYMICLFVKQIRAARRAKREQKYEETV